MVDVPMAPQAQLADVPPAARWPGFSVANLGPWSYQLRCDSCGKSTSPASLNQTLLDVLVSGHRCGPPLSTHWGEAVSLGAAYAVAIVSYAMHVEQMPYGLGAEPDVRAACDRLEEAVLSHRRAADDVAEQFDAQSPSLYQTGGRMLLELSLDEMQARDDVEAAAAESHPPVYVTVAGLVGGGRLPARPVTGEAALGVVWAPGALCIGHLVEQLNDGRLLEQLGPEEGGVVIYPGDNAPACGECPCPEPVDAGGAEPVQFGDEAALDAGEVLS